MKKIVLTFVTILIFEILGTVFDYADSETIEFNNKDSTVCVNNYEDINYSDLKVVVKKGSEKYIYNI